MGGNDHRRLAAHQYAIINPLQVERSQWNELSTIPLVPQALYGREQSMPHLLHLMPLDDSQRADLLTRADTWDAHNDHAFFGLLLKSPVSPERLVPHLTRQLVIRMSQGGALLRWYDPRVFRHLRWLLTIEQLHGFSGPVTAWTWRESSEHWLTHEVPAANSVHTQLRLTPDQEAKIGRMGVLNRTIAQLKRCAPELVIDDDLSRRLDAYLQQAFDRYGLIDEADARLFAEQAVRYPGIHQQPDAIQRLECVRQGQISYVGACAGWNLEASHRSLGPQPTM